MPRKPKTRPDPVRLERAGRIALPERLGSLVRAQIVPLGDDAIYATYAQPGDGPGGAEVVISVGPPPRPPAVELAAREAAGRGLGPLIALRDLPVPSAAPGAIGRLWCVEINAVPVTTGVVIWLRDGLRITFAGTPAGEGCWAEVQGLIDAFDWAGTLVKFAAATRIKAAD